MLKNLFLAIGALISISMVACSGDNVAGGTIDPNNQALASSTSEQPEPERWSSSSDDGNPNDIKQEGDELSSSSSKLEDRMEGSSSSDGTQKDLNPFVSSSSQRGQTNLIVRPRNFSLECSVDVIYVDLAEIPASETPSVSKDVLAPYASKSIAADSVNIMISDYFAIPCGESEAEAFVKQTNEPGNASFGLAGDTLYVDVTRSKSMTYGCACVAQVKFTLDANNSGIQYTVFEQTEAIPLEEFE